MSRLLFGNAPDVGAQPVRSRWWLIITIVCVILLGLASRKYPVLFPSLLGNSPGDALWAVMVFLGWAFLRPQVRTKSLALVALATSWSVEFSQLYQAEWINAVRSTTLGHLALGSTFFWPDLVAYTVGVLGAAITDVLFLRILPGVESREVG